LTTRVSRVFLACSLSLSFWVPSTSENRTALSFLVSFYKIRWGKNHPKST
jgi:hypothetical protein